MFDPINSSPPGRNCRYFADDIFRCIFVNEKFFFLILIKKFTEDCSLGSNWQYHSIGLDNGLAPNRQQAIIWTNSDQTNWRVYAVLGGISMNQCADKTLLVSPFSYIPYHVCHCSEGKCYKYLLIAPSNSICGCDLFRIEQTDIKCCQFAWRYCHIIMFFVLYPLS